jgi:hypothetical protein
MSQPPNDKRDSSTPGNNSIMIIGILIGVGIVVLAAMAIFLFRGSIFQLTTPATQTPVIPTMFVPTADCGPPTLVLGTTTWQIQTTNPAADGSLSVPPDTSGIAYWVEATDTNYVFVLSPTPDNLSLISGLTAGDTAKATWSNCNSTTYNLFTLEQSPASISTLLDQSTSGITIFVQSDPSTASLVVRGELTEEQLSTVNTPAAGTEIQAEISLLETIPSSDGATIKVGISIQNYGTAAFALSMDDVSLIQPDAIPLILVNSEPPLPKEIGVGATEIIYFTFPRPNSHTATIRILDIEYEVDGY